MDHKTLINGIRKKDLRMKDSLTGLMTRNSFLIRVGAELLKNPDGDYVLACWDIDRFKVYNALFGSGQGDEVLAQLGACCKEQAAKDDCIAYARFEADCFESCWRADTFDADVFIREVSSMVSKVFGTYFATACFGFCAFSGSEKDVSAVCDRARIALRSAKKNYEQHYQWYNDEMYQKIVNEQELFESLVNAIENGELQPWYQPQFNYNLSELIGAEALARWVHGDTVYSPVVFIPILEENGLIYEADKKIWEQVCAQQRSWIDQGIPVLPVSINISRRDLYHEDIIDVLNDLVRQYNLDKSLLRLEITESAYLDNPEILVKKISQLREDGFIIEIDDFGSGFSSLNMLNDVEVDKLKLDLGFLQGSSKRSGPILSSVVRMASHINLDVMAEGVETLRQADYLKSIGCSQMQGFLFSKPVPAEQYTWMLLNHSRGVKTGITEPSSTAIGEEFLDSDPQADLFFNSFVGGAVIVEYDGKSLDLVRSNDAFFRVIGADREEIRSEQSQLLDSVLPEYRERFNEALERAKKTGEEQVFEVCSVDKYGNPLWTNNRARFLTGSNGSDFYYIGVENVTAKHELMENNSRLLSELDAVIRNVPDGLARVHIQGLDFCFEFISDSFEEILHYPKGELLPVLNDQPGTILHPAEYSALMNLIHNRASSGTPFHLCCHLRRKEGDFILCEIRGVFEGTPEDCMLHMSCTDVSDAADAKARLALSNDEFRAAAVQSGQMFCRYNYADRSINVLQETAECFDSVTYMPDACEGLIKEGYIDPQSEEAWRSMFAELENGKAGTAQDLHIKGLHGTWRWYSATYTPCIRSGKDKTAVICFRDVTDQHELQRSFLKDSDSLYQVMRNLFPSVHACNLTANTARAIERTGADRPFEGRDENSYDGYIEEMLQMIPAGERRKFEEVFSREALIKAFSEGKDSISFFHSQTGQDGLVHSVESVALKVSGADNGDCTVLFLSRPAEAASFT